MKKAFITGVTGQDGSYLADLLLEKGYEVYGLVRRKSKVDHGNAEHLLGKVNFLYGDICDEVSLNSAIETSRPDEVYNLAAQSFVGASWNQPKATADMNGIGVLNLLEAIRIKHPKARFYQASTSELFGMVQEVPQSETTPFYPRSPYGVAKLYGHWITKNYRESYKMYACSGILFNHESERRGLEFVTRKITNAVANIKFGRQSCLDLGNLDAKRDWGHAADYVKGMYLMLQQEQADDYVLASGETHTVRKFVELAFSFAGISITWSGEGIKEEGKCKNTGKTLVKVNPEFFRPAEVELLLGDPTKAQNKLGWKREISFENLVERMVKYDIDIISASEKV